MSRRKDRHLYVSAGLRFSVPGPVPCGVYLRTWFVSFPHLKWESLRLDSGRSCTVKDPTPVQTTQSPLRQSEV